MAGVFATWRAQLANPPRPDALAWLALSAVLIAFDQWTKWLALTHLQFATPVPVIDGFWNWTLVYNYGAAFSFLADAGGWQKWIFAGLAVVISAGMTLWLRLTPRRDWRTALPLALVISGALGNLIDRVLLGFVVDFVDVVFGTWHFWAFNVADAAINIGAVLFIADTLFSRRHVPETV